MKATRAILFCILFPLLSQGQQALGPSFGTNYGNIPIAGSGSSWVNPSNASASDNIYTSFGNLPETENSFSDYLFITDFGFSLPTGAIISGIRVSIERSDPNACTMDNSIRLLKSGTPGNTDRSSDEDFPLTDAVHQYGGTEDLWGDTWSYKDVSDPGFGVAISVKRNKNAGITAGRIDNVSITVFYRFMTLPLVWNEITISKESRAAIIQWKTSEESNLEYYCVERSTDGEHFTVIGTVAALNRPSAKYTFRDISPIAGISYYRMNLRENSGKTIYSRLLRLNFDAKELLAIFPSPCKVSSALYIINPVREELKVRFYNTAGTKVAETSTSNESLQLPINISSSQLVYYKIFNKTEQLKGSGSLLVN